MLLQRGNGIENTGSSVKLVKVTTDLLFYFKSIFKLFHLQILFKYLRYLLASHNRYHACKQIGYILHFWGMI